MNRVWVVLGFCWLSMQAWGFDVVEDPERGRLISDSLVKNLSCRDLSQANVFRFVREDAFEIRRHIPLSNWSFSGLQECWGLTLAQRNFFYLMRFGESESSESPTEDQVNSVLDFIGSPKTFSRKKVIQIRDLGLNERGQNAWDPLVPTSFFTTLLLGTQNPVRTFRGQIEGRQAARFWSLRNLSLVFGNRARPQLENQVTMNHILDEASRGRMPLLVLRARLFAQHTVLVKKVQQKSPGSYEMTLYDPNQPAFELSVLEYRDQNFFGNAALLNRFDPFNDSTSPVGVFVVDEEDMEAIQRVNAEYYAELCRQPLPSRLEPAPLEESEQIEESAEPLDEE